MEVFNKLFLIIWIFKKGIFEMGGFVSMNIMYFLNLKYLNIWVLGF